MMNDNFLKIQIKQNLLAIISVVIAISALTYNSWRNEQSEENRNLRAAGFEIMRESAQLQYLIDTATYSDKPQHADPIRGWVSINLIISLSKLMPIDIQERANKLKSVWSEDWAELYDNQQKNEEVSKANSQLIESVRESLYRLN